MKVSELARAAGVNPQTVRYYERVGLLPKPDRLESGYRDFGPDALRRLRFILEAKEIGFTLAEIQQLLGLDGASPDSCGCVRELVEARLADLEEKLAAIKRVRKTLKRVAQFCDENPPDKPCPVLDMLH